jgi:AcrR family transcriptional regulator
MQMETKELKITSPEPKKRRDKEASMKKLLEAGIEVFSQYGYDGATTKKVSQKAGVTESLIIRYFGSKEGLLFAILKSYIEQCELEEAPYPEGKDLEEEFVRFTHHQLMEDLESKDFLKVVIGRSTVDPEFNKKLREGIPLEGRGFLRERLKKTSKLPKNLPNELTLVDLQRMISFQVFACSYLGHILLGQSEDQLKNHLGAFCKIFAAGLESIKQQEIEES